MPLPPRRLRIAASDIDAQGRDHASPKKFARLNDTVIVTKDEDFAQRKMLAPTSPVVVCIRLPNTRQRELLAWFETVLIDMLSAIERGETLIELV